MDQTAFEQFSERFATEQACVEALFAARWPDGYRCPGCHHTDYYEIAGRRLPLYECRRCRRQTSVTAGTVIEGSRTLLSRWFQAIWLLSQPQGINAVRLSQILRVTYKTAWLMAHKIRHAIQQDDLRLPLTGEVRVNQIHYGYSFYRDARQPLLIGATLDRGREPDRVKLKMPAVDHVNTRRRVQPAGFSAFVHLHIDKKASVSESHGLADRPLMQIKASLSAWLNDTFHGIGPKHLQAYADEFSFHWNQAKRRTCALTSLLRHCAAYPTIRYRELIADKPTLPAPWIIWKTKGKWRGHYLTILNV